MTEQVNKGLVYLIEKIWVEPIENDACEALGYNPFGFVRTEESAKTFCAKGRLYTKKDCWVIENPIPEYRYKPLNEIEKL